MATDTSISSRPKWPAAAARALRGCPTRLAAQIRDAGSNTSASVDTANIGKSRLTDMVISPPLDPWAALADGTRRAIFKRLTSRPMAVGELARELPVSRPAVSQHLKVLKSAGLVQDRAAGTRRLYHVNPEGVAALRAELDTFWDQTLDTYNNLVEQEGHPR